MRPYLERNLRLVVTDMHWLAVWWNQWVSLYCEVLRWILQSRPDGVNQAHLPMNKNHWSQKSPRSTLTIYMQHSQDLEETDPSAFKEIRAYLVHRAIYYNKHQGSMIITSCSTDQTRGWWCFCWSYLYLIADVANTCPLDPTLRTTTEATTTIRSVSRTKEEIKLIHTQSYI